MLLIGAKIQEYRKKQGLSQEEFAAKVGVTRQAASKWETDKAYPDLDKLVSICDILRIGITELIYGESVAVLEDSSGQPPERQDAAEGTLPERQGAAEAAPPEGKDAAEVAPPEGKNAAETALPKGKDAAEGTLPERQGAAEVAPPEKQGAAEGVLSEGKNAAEGALPDRQGNAARPLLEMNAIAVGKVRGRRAYFRLWAMLALLGGMFLFCGVLLATTLVHYSWEKDDALGKLVRVERVYQQYTKADLSFYDDVSRRVVKTVWLDINGIREGDSLFCYTDGEQKGIYYEYRQATLFVLAAVELVFFSLLILVVGEFRRFGRENGWHVLTDEAKEKGKAGRGV